MLLAEGRVLNNLETTSLRSKCFRGIWKWRKIKERWFGCFRNGKRGAWAKYGMGRGGKEALTDEPRDFEKPVQQQHGLWLSQFEAVITDLMAQIQQVTVGVHRLHNALSHSIKKEASIVYVQPRSRGLGVFSWMQKCSTRLNYSFKISINVWPPN